MEEAFGSMASSMSHLPQEFAFGQMQLPHLKKEEKKWNRYSPGELDTPLARVMFLRYSHCCWWQQHYNKIKCENSVLIFFNYHVNMLKK